jgi:type II secretory pathway component GspD/PulD (secretin)
VFIRPQILRTGAEASAISQSKYNFVKDLQEAGNEKPVKLMRSETRPVLPDLPAREPDPASGNEDAGDGR